MRPFRWRDALLKMGVILGLCVLWACLLVFGLHLSWDGRKPAAGFAAVAIPYLLGVWHGRRRLKL